MAHGLVMSTDTANAACDAVVDRVDRGALAGKLYLYPSTSAPGFTTGELGSVALNDPAFGAAAAGVATLDVDPAITVPIASAGTLAYVVFKSGDTGPVYTTEFYGTIGTTSDYDMTVTNTVVGVGDQVSITSCTFTMPTS